jgi:hypothetical protein
VGTDRRSGLVETRVQIRRYFYAEQWKVGTIAKVAVVLKGVCWFFRVLSMS